MTTYKDAGVDIEAGNLLVERIKPMAANTFSPGVMTDIGGFAGLFSLNTNHIANPVLVSATDGVGTKLKIAFESGIHDTIGIDLVAMVVNDIIVKGASPLFLLDYIAVDKLDIDKATSIIKGIAEGCKQAECALIGGETAEMPGVYHTNEYDLAGFAVGIVGRDNIIDGSEIAIGNDVIGICSSGIHSNGYSLIRKIRDNSKAFDDYTSDSGQSMIEQLLTPTKIYVKTIKTIIRNYKVNGIAHITGGGLIENIKRVLPQPCDIKLTNTEFMKHHPIFEYIKIVGAVSDEEMLSTFNNGIGMVLIVDKQNTEDIMQQLDFLGEDNYLIGEICKK